MTLTRFRAAALAGVVALAGCGVADRVEREAENAVSSGIESAIGDRVERELQKAGIELQGGVDCNSNIDLASLADGVDGQVTCNGKTREGQRVEATFDGTLSPDGTCRGTVVVTVEGKEQARTPETNVCAQG